MLRIKFKISFVLLVVILITISSCKKGEDDPAISLSTRKARLSGDWKLQSGKVVYGVKDASGAQAGYTYELKKDSYELVNFKGGRFSGTSALAVSFKKDGGFSVSQTLDSLHYDATGTWDFQGKTGKAKNKETVTIRMDNINGISNYFTQFNKSLPLFSYRIKELRSHKLVLVCEEDRIGIDKSGATYVTAEYVFEQ